MCIIVHNVCRAIVDILLPRYICFPSGEDLQRTVDGFHAVWDIPQCAGAIDGSHIPILGPAENHTDYYNRKGWYSVLVQATVDHRYCFTDINVGWPGSVHDARVLANSSLYAKALAGTLLPDTPQNIAGVQVPLYIIGDSAYPLMVWLMKPFPFSSNLSTEQKKCNYRMSRARIVVENAFGRLKARWRRLMKNEMRIVNVPTVVAACCVLHNVCQIHGDSFNESWLDDGSATTETPQPNRIATVNDSSERPRKIRNALVTYFCSN